MLCMLTLKIKMINVYEYKLKSSIRWLTMIAPGCDLEEARKSCKITFGDNFLDIRCG